MNTLFDLIAYIETHAHYAAFRFEPATFAKLLIRRTDSQKLLIQRIIDCNGGPSQCSWGTALAIYSTSFGAVQIMGFNLYGPAIKFDGSVLEFLTPCFRNANEPRTVQLDAFNKFMVSLHLQKATPELLALHPELRQEFAKQYNGSASAYAPLIVAALKKNGFPTPTI